jgi:lipid-A-disaccharide synthase
MSRVECFSPNQTLPLKTLFLVAGEISGDTHGAALVSALQRSGDWKIAGLGGPLLAAQSEAIENWLEDAAVLGLWEVLKKYSYFREKMEEAVARIHESQPNGIVFIDYPGFNLRLAKRLREEGYEGKLIYYISPQVWAWKKGRVRTMAQLLDLMICIFPFEKDLYENSGLPTVFAGHPLVDSMEQIRDAELTRDPKLVALLPGSREREIAKLFPPMLDAAEILLGKDPELRFTTTGAIEKLTGVLREMVRARGLEDHFRVGEESSYEIMQCAWTGVVASGTATLEAACLGLPYCLTYKVAWLTAAVARRVMSVDYLGIVNVLAGREVVREILQGEARGEVLAEEIFSLLTDVTKRTQLQESLAEVVATLGDGGCDENAAAAISDVFRVSSPTD